MGNLVVSTLFTFKEGTANKQSLEKLKAFMQEQDILVFIEDGVSWCLKPELIGINNYFFLEEDLLLRGIADRAYDENKINYQQFAQLLADNKMVAW